MQSQYSVKHPVLQHYDLLRGMDWTGSGTVEH